MRIFKPGTKTPEELEYEKEFIRKANKCAEHNKRKNYETNVSRKYKKVVRRKAIPIYQVNNDTTEIIAEFSCMTDAGKSINMTASNFSDMMMDRPIYTPVLIKGKWFIKQSHYGHWREKRISQSSIL